MKYNSWITYVKIQKKRMFLGMVFDIIVTLLPEKFIYHLLDYTIT